MPTVRLGRTNIHVPVISLGTWGHGGPRNSGSIPVGWAGHDDELARKALTEAWRRGITHWDTADAYGNGQAEELIGSVWGEVPRDDIFLASKVGWIQGDYDHFYHPELMRRQMERSLQSLKTEVIDLYYFHHCDFGDQGQYLDDALELVKRFRDEGKIRFIGLSDWSAQKVITYLDRIDPDVVQVYRNVVDDEWESSGLRALVESRDLGVAFFSPLRHGLLLGKYDKATIFPDGDFRTRIDGFNDPAVIEAMKRAALRMRERFGGFPEPVLHALAGALLTDAPTACVLLGMRNPAQVEAASVIGDPLRASDARWVKGVYQRAGAGR